MRREVIVIGGGPAGAAVATLLAKAGRDVLLLEKEAAATHKVCGEFLSWNAVRSLGRLGLDLAALGAAHIHRLHLSFGSGILDVPLPGAAASLSRRALDEALLSLAAAHGAEVRRGAAVTSLQPEGGQWRVTAEGSNYEAGAVFLASGKSDLRGWPRRHGSQSRLIGFKMHYRLRPAQTAALRGATELLLFRGGYAGLELVEKDVANLCLLVNRDDFKAAGGQWPGFIDSLMNAAPFLRERLEGAQGVWEKPLAVYGMPYGYIHENKPEEENLYRLGDQMAVIPSFAGDGMSMALHSALIAAGCYLEGAGAAACHARLGAEFKRPVRLAGIVAAMALSPVTRPLLHGVATRAPALLTRAAESLRFNPA